MEKKIRIDQFLDGDGRLVKLPAKQKVRYAALSYVAKKFDLGAEYTELEVNGICQRWHTFGDFHLLRREMVDFGLLGRERDGSRYWRILPDEPLEAEEDEQQRTASAGENA